MKKFLTFVLALSIAFPLQAESYSVLIRRYESEIRRQERQLRSLQSNLREKQEKVAVYKRLAEKAKSQWERLADSVKTAQLKITAVRNELLKTSHQAQVAGWQEALEARLSNSIDSELAALTVELFRRQMVDASGVEVSATATYPVQLVEHLTDYAPVVRQDAQTAAQQKQSMEASMLRWQTEELKRRKEAEALKLNQSEQWRRWQEAQHREELLKEDIAQAEQSAQALLVMLAQLKDNRDQAKAQHHPTVNVDDHQLAQLRGRLPWPAPGEVVQPFGRQYSSELNQLLISNGIRVQAQSGRPVRVVQPGQVIFARPFHNYGEMVVVQHANGLASVYAGLATITVKEGAQLGALEAIGNADPSGRYYFELRHEERPLDPLVYLTPSRRMSS